jgi:hypothetical protein
MRTEFPRGSSPLVFESLASVAERLRSSLGSDRTHTHAHARTHAHLWTLSHISDTASFAWWQMCMLGQLRCLNVTSCREGACANNPLQVEILQHRQLLDRRQQRDDPVVGHVVITGCRREKRERRRPQYNSTESRGLPECFRSSYA